MRKYLKPEIRVVYIEPLDIIATSTDPEDDDNTTGTTPFMPWG